MSFIACCPLFGTGLIRFMGPLGRTTCSMCTLDFYLDQLRVYCLDIYTALFPEKFLPTYWLEQSPFLLLYLWVWKLAETSCFSGGGWRWFCYGHLASWTIFSLGFIHSVNACVKFTLGSLFPSPLPWPIQVNCCVNF